MATNNIYWIDLFCGAGGTTTGVHQANANAKVIACVNHDANAIMNHKANHPDCIHFTEDIRDFAVVTRLNILVQKIRKNEPEAVINIWASLECTNYSKAKGGLPRDADSRTLANHLFMYLEELEVNYLYVENVREFMAWGALDENGKPESRDKGKEYVHWCNKIQRMGYNYDWKLLNAANFGARTSRTRYFGIFAKKGFPIKWPEETHSKTSTKDAGLFEQTKLPWNPVRPVLDLENEGSSIFGRKKDLADRTLERIFAGLIKFVANGEDFLYHNHGGEPSSKVWSMDKPTRTIMASGGHYKVKCVFLTSYYGNTRGAQSVENPCPTITTKDRFQKLNVQFLTNNYTNGGVTSSIDRPAPTITTTPKSNLTTCKIDDRWIMDTNFGNVGKSLDEPSSTIVASRRYNYIMNPQYKSKGSSVDKPAPTIIARQDKAPLYVMACDESKEEFGIAVYEEDSEITVKIKAFMVSYGITDIKMRMLLVQELKEIQGFPKDYKLSGTQKDQKKFIGNSVAPIVAQRLIEANAEALTILMEKVA